MKFYRKAAGLAVWIQEEKGDKFKAEALLRESIDLQLRF
jgi:hypothetical protein